MALRPAAVGFSACRRGTHSRHQRQQERALQSLPARDVGDRSHSGLSSRRMMTIRLSEAPPRPRRPALRRAGAAPRISIAATAAFSSASSAGVNSNCGRADVLEHVRHLRRPGDGHDPRLLRHQPGQRDLRGSGLLPLGPALHQLHERQVVRAGSPARSGTRRRGCRRRRTASSRRWHRSGTPRRAGSTARSRCRAPRRAG